VSDDPLRLFLVLRKGAIASLERACVLAGAAAVRHLRDHPPPQEWLERPGKICLRARTRSQWEQVREDAVTLAGETDGEAVAAIGPRGRSERGPVLERLQAMSTELEPLPSELPETRDEVVYVVNPRCAMSSGKTIAQVAHAAVIAADHLPGWSPSAARAVRPDEAVFDALCERDDLAARVVDAGLTEVPPGTVTVLALGLRARA
jgi:hypothetical protein